MSCNIGIGVIKKGQIQLSPLNSRSRGIAFKVYWQGN